MFVDLLVLKGKALECFRTDAEGLRGKVMLPPARAEVSSIDLRSLGIKPQDWALAALAALAKTNWVISVDMLRAALTTRFRDDVLASAVQLVEKVYKN